MQEMLTSFVYFGVVLTLICYEIGLWIKKKTGFALANPLLIASIIIIGVLLFLGIDYEVYKVSVQPISFLLTPATVCLAFSAER